MHAQEHASFDASAAEPTVRTTLAARAVIPEGNGDAPLRFMAQHTGAALAWRPYRLHIAGRLVLGRTDANGFTAPLSGAERAALADWEVE